MSFVVQMSKLSSRNLTLALILIFTIGPLSAATWYAAPAAAGAGDASSPADPDTIFNILGGAYPLAAGDSIEMAAGGYAIGGGTLVVNLPLHIYGMGPGATVLFNGNPTFQFNPASSGSALTMLTIDQSFSDGVSINDAQVDVKDVDVRWSNGTGIYVNGPASTGGISRVGLYNNNTGIHSSASALSYVGNSKIDNNTAWGILFEQNGVALVERNEITTNGIGMEILDVGNAVTTSENNFVSNGTGILIQNPGVPGGNKILNNNFEFTANVAVAIGAPGDQTIVNANHFYKDGMAISLGKFTNTKVTNNIIRETIGTAIMATRSNAGIYFNTIAWAWEGIHVRGFNGCQVDNNIVYQCTATGIWADGAVLNANCNDSWGNAPNYLGAFAGGGNISVDPQFTFGAPFFQLASTSPLNGAACNTWIGSDHYGNTRDAFPFTEPGAIEN